MHTSSGGTSRARTTPRHVWHPSIYTPLNVCRAAHPCWGAASRPSRRRPLRQCRFCLGEPEGHVHRRVHLDGRGQLRAGLFPLTGRGVQCAETTVAVGLEGAHTEFLGQGERLLVVGFGLLGFWWG